MPGTYAKHAAFHICHIFITFMVHHHFGNLQYLFGADDFKFLGGFLFAVYHNKSTDRMDFTALFLQVHPCLPASAVVGYCTADGGTVVHNGNTGARYCHTLNNDFTAFYGARNLDGNVFHGTVHAAKVFLILRIHIFKPHGGGGADSAVLFWRTGESKLAIDIVYTNRHNGFGNPDGRINLLLDTVFPDAFRMHGKALRNGNVNPRNILHHRVTKIIPGIFRLQLIFQAEIHQTVRGNIAC